MLNLMLAAAGAEAAEHGEGAVHTDPTALGFDPTGWVALAMLAVFAIFIWKKVPGAVGKALDKKIAEIREQLDEAETLRKEAEALKAEYQAKAAAADSEAAAMIDRAKSESKTIVAKAKKDAEALVERRAKLAESKIAAEERAAVADIRAATAKAAAQAAATIIASKNDAKSDKSLVDQAIANL